MAGYKPSGRIRKQLDLWTKEHEHQIREFRYAVHLIRGSPLSMVGIGIVLALFLVAIFAPYIIPYPDDAIKSAIHPEQKLQPPSWEHLFGTDDMGRDIFSRVIYGSRISLPIGIAVIAIAMGIGVPLGAIAGLLGGKIDEIIMRATDTVLAFPPFILALAIAAAMGPSIINALIAIAFTWWPWYTRLVRGQTLSLREQPFVEAARALGANRLRIILHHIIPNTLAPATVQASLDLGYSILMAAALSFVGLGARVPQPEWGLMIAVGRTYLPAWWWPATFPGLAIVVAVLGFNLLGDGLRDILDPRLRR